MKSKEQLKKELHEYIDSIIDEETLMMVHEDVVSYIKRGDEIEEDEELTEEQEKQLAEAIRQADAGEIISYEEEYLKSTARWHTK